MAVVEEEMSIQGYLRQLEGTIEEESKKPEKLRPFLLELRQAIENQNYPQAAILLDELEEFIDLYDLMT